MKNNKLKDYKTITNLDIPCQEFNNIIYAMYRKTMAFTIEAIYYKETEPVKQQIGVIYDMHTLWAFEGEFNELLEQYNPDSVDVYLDSLSMTQLVDLVKGGK